MATSQQKPLCILQFAKTNFVTTVQRLFRTRFGIKTFGDEPRRTLKIIRRFGERCSCYLQGEYVMDGSFWKQGFISRKQ
jgi:hypothetical protein